LLHSASDGFLLATMTLGRDGTEMRPMKDGPQSIVALTTDQLEDIVSLLRLWEREPQSLTDSHRYVVPWDLNEGRNLYISHCSGCHGIDGRAEQSDPDKLSAWAPELNNQGFLNAATDGFIQATVIRGRTGTAMRAFGPGTQGLSALSPEQINTIVAFIRTWQRGSGPPTTILAEHSKPSIEPDSLSNQDRSPNP
jgi:mono/diheme cytochrome c family protein